MRVLTSVRVTGSDSDGRGAGPSCSSARSPALRVGLSPRSSCVCGSPAPVRVRPSRVAWPVTATEVAWNDGLRPPLPGVPACGQGGAGAAGGRYLSLAGVQGERSSGEMLGWRRLPIQARQFEAAAPAGRWICRHLPPPPSQPASAAHLALGGGLLAGAQGLDGGGALQLGPGVFAGGALAQEGVPRAGGLGAALQGRGWRGTGGAGSGLARGAAGRMAVCRQAMQGL